MTYAPIIHLLTTKIPGNSEASEDKKMQNYRGLNVWSYRDYSESIKIPVFGPN